MSAPLLEVRGLTKHFPVRGGVLLRRVGAVHAVDGVSFSLQRGETLGLVGESGCGKSTVGKTLLRLLEPSAGSIFFEGNDITRLGGNELRALRREVQIVFQDTDDFTDLEQEMKAYTIGDRIERLNLL